MGWAEHTIEASLTSHCEESNVFKIDRHRSSHRERTDNYRVRTRVTDLAKLVTRAVGLDAPSLYFVEHQYGGRTQDDSELENKGRWSEGFRLGHDCRLYWHYYIERPRSIVWSISVPHSAQRYATSSTPSSNMRGMIDFTPITVLHLGHNWTKPGGIAWSVDRDLMLSSGKSQLVLTHHGSFHRSMGQ
jgi:hypothetical protein